jgi:membrane-bound metal-dependent hydrolase YbcI (DUF457 family)
MPLAVTHVAPALILFNYLKKKFHIEKYEFKHIAFVSTIGALLPDADIFLGRFLHLYGFNLTHGSYAHTTFFAFLFIFPAIIFYLFKKYRLALFFSLLGFGIVLHIFLDYLIGGGAEAGVMWFFPFSNQSYKIHLLSALPFPFWAIELDALVLLGWIYLKSDSFK